MEKEIKKPTAQKKEEPKETEKKEVEAPQPQPEKVPEGVNLDELSEMSGEKGMRRTKYSVPILKFNGNTGKFTLLTPDTQGNFVPAIVPGAKVSGVILKIRRIFTAFTKTQAGENISYFSNEHNSWKDRLVLFERRKFAPKPKMIDEGSREEIRGKWQDLKLRQYLYMLYKGKIVKLGIQGGNLGPLFDYLKSFSEGLHVFQFNTDIKCHQETNDAGMSYFRLDFDRGTKSNIIEVAEKIKEVKDALDAQDKAFEEQGKLVQEGLSGEVPTSEFKAEEAAEGPVQGQPKVPTIDQESGEEVPPPPDEPEEEIKVEDIPM